MTDQRNRIEFIHFLRGIAPLLVLWAHIPGWWLADTQNTWWVHALFQQWIASPLRLYQNGGQFGVALFFIISGFIISYTTSDKSRIVFLIKRMVRLLPLLIFALLVMAVAQLVSGILGLTPIIGHYQKLEVWDYLRNLALLTWLFPEPKFALSVTWSLFTEVVFYAMFFVAVPWTRTHPVLSTIALLLAGMAINAIVYQHPYTKHLNGVLLCLPVFLIGRSLYLMWDKAVTNREGVALFVASIGGFAVLQQGIYPHSTPQLCSTYILAVGLFVGAMVYTPRLLQPIFGFFADISYALYLLHMPIGMLTLNYLYKSGFSLGACIAAAWTTSIVGAWAATTLVDRPFQKIGQRFVPARGKSIQTCTSTSAPNGPLPEAQQ